jgi:hypothetical protein
MRRNSESFAAEKRQSRGLPKTIFENAERPPAERQTGVPEFPSGGEPPGFN